MSFYKSSPGTHVCINCFDTGFMFMKEHQKEGTFLVKCSCDFGKSRVTEFIPDFKPVLAQIFEKIPFPASSFIPPLAENATEEQVWSGIVDRMEKWRTKIKNSEKFWKHKIQENKRLEAS